jgi:hypothetical protein
MSSYPHQPLLAPGKIRILKNGIFLEKFIAQVCYDREATRRPLATPLNSGHGHQKRWLTLIQRPGEPPSETGIDLFYDFSTVCGIFWGFAGWLIR